MGICWYKTVFKFIKKYDENTCEKQSFTDYDKGSNSLYKIHVFFRCKVTIGDDNVFEDCTSIL